MHYNFSEYAGQDEINDREKHGHCSDKKKQIDSAPVDRNIRMRKREENFRTCSR